MFYELILGVSNKTFLEMSELSKFSKINLKQKNRFIASALALFVLLIVFLSGPAAAFSVTWDISDETPNTGDTITIEAEVVKETTEVYTDDIQFKITKPNGSTVLFGGNCSPEVSDFAGYGYGTYGYGVLGYSYGYQSGYGYGLSHETTITCSTSYIVDDIEGTYTIELVNVSNGTEYVIGESTQVVATTATTPSSGSSTTTTTGTTQGTTPVETIVTVYEDTVDTSNLTPQELGDLLGEMTDDQGNALFTPEEIQAMIDNAGEYDFEIEVKTEKITNAQGQVSYKTTITTTITNSTGKDQKNVRVVVEVPKAVSETASRITSQTLFTILKDDPVLEFTLPLLKAGQSQEITYQVTDTTQPELDGIVFNDPMVSFAEEVTTTTGTDDGTETGDDTSSNELPPTGDNEAPPMDFTLIIIVIIILIVIGVLFYKREDIKKALKK